MTNAITRFMERRAAGEAVGIPSICSSHPMVIEATLRRCKRDGAPALIEATCNQVNHEGGYTGMTPRDFVAEVRSVADRVGFDTRNLVFGGDHLGPNPWRKLPADRAMAKSEAMVAAFVAAGFAKIHLDPSMGCAGEPEALDDELTTERAVRLARVAEATAKQEGIPAPHYIIGTEVPPPGGARHALDLDYIEPTTPERARATLATFQRAFATAGLEAAFARVIGIVVQPGVEFGHESVIQYDPARARPLSHALDDTGLVFEAHSTDYQPPVRLTELVRDRFCILKVGPALTFALREALYGLDLIASEMAPDYPARALASAMEKLMLAEPRWWEPYYPGGATEQRLLRHYSYSDRIRYYWPHPEAKAAVERLKAALLGVAIPTPVLQQFLPRLAPHAFDSEETFDRLIIASIDEALGQYASACTP
ncbi:MAG: class II D-tagatose-bisphosphate aldolase, non-catalytic subunit [Roseiarcus sp.]|jgi:D-tagatose-1,6-bisphosphate aldolase subunit GatZ/KbaZ